MSYPNVLAGSTSALTETATGATETVTAVTVGSPQEFTISENGTATANVVNTYDYVPGALVVTKNIYGPGRRPAGPGFHRRQLCIGRPYDSLGPFVIPTGHAAGIIPHVRWHPGRLDLYRD